MATIAIDGDTLELTVEGADRLLALRSHLRIPLSAVLGASADAAVTGSAAAAAGLRIIGTSIPGVLRAGSFRTDGGWVFWDVHDLHRAVVIDLEHEHYRRLVVEVTDPAATAALITKALHRPSGPPSA